MDRRSWPWKKKTSEKTVTATDSVNGSLYTLEGNQVDQENIKGPSYVQISMESYAHLNDLEELVKDLEEKLTSANENLSSSQSEITAKDILVKQHAKVAEEAVSGWEKAEAEAAALKHQLETVTLLKLTAEERASHLDGALKECMKQIRNVKEESEQKLHDVIFAKTKQWEKIKVELEVKIADFEQELLRASGENDALSRALQERSIMLMNISEEKSEADGEIEVLKDNIQSREKEINSLKYELHIIAKEFEIRNEEKNMSVKSAEVSNKQHLEDVKKVTKLEAECQRLRGLVRKKLPGPAAIAQMKVEVENLGRDFGETRLRRSPARGSSPRRLSVPDFAIENIQQRQKENEFLTARFLTMEEETQMLKEALAKRNSELQASRSMCAKTMNKLHGLEAQILAFNQQKSPTRPNSDIRFENGSNTQSLTSMSEDGIDEEGSCSESWATALISELSHFKKDKDVDKGNKTDQLELMDDFLEMERLACSPTDEHRSVSASEEVVNMKTMNDDSASLVDVQKTVDGREEDPQLELATNQSLSNEENPEGELPSTNTNDPLSKLHSRIAFIFECKTECCDMEKVLENIRSILLDTQTEFLQNTVNCDVEETHSTATCKENHSDEAMGEVNNDEVPLINGNLCAFTLDQELKDAISHINDYIISLGKEVLEMQHDFSDHHGLSKKIDEFTSSVDKLMCNELGLKDVVLAISRVLFEATALNFSIFGANGKGRDNSSSECIDKVTLLENKIDQHEPNKGEFSETCMLVPSTNPDIERPVDLGIEQKAMQQSFSLVELEQLKLEKENLHIDIARYAEMLEQTKLKLIETEQQVVELKSQLATSENSNSLAETQLKCMTESYKALESRKQELESEISLLRSKEETLDFELQEERRNHQDSLAKCKALREQLERNEKLVGSNDSDADADNKTKQEKEIAAASEKLAEFQETILLLGKQLKSMRPPVEISSSSPDNEHRINDAAMGDEPSPSGSHLHRMNSTHKSNQVEMGSSVTSVTQIAGGELQVDEYNSHISPSDGESGPSPGSPISSKRQKHRSSGTSSLSTSSNTLSEKHGRGLSRFFSKGK